MKKEDILSGLRRLRPSEGQCAGCGHEHNCAAQCRIGREAAELIETLERELEQEKGRVSWAVGLLLRATEQLKGQVDACESCAHSGTQVPCFKDEDPTMLCDTCQRECACKTCKDYSGWIWNGGGPK